MQLLLGMAAFLVFLGVLWGFITDKAFTMQVLEFVMFFVLVIAAICYFR